MKVPNATIIITTVNGGCSVKTQPAYFAAMYLRVWGNRLDPEKGILVQDVPEVTPLSARYTEYSSVAEAERALVAYFAAGDSNQEPAILAHFTSLFPEGLAGDIRKLLTADAKRWQKLAVEKKNAPVAHPSYLEIGVPAVNALALAAAGYPTLLSTPDDLLMVAEAGNLDAGIASHIIACADEQREVLAREKTKSQHQASDEKKKSHHKAHDSKHVDEKAETVKTPALTDPTR